MQAYVINLDRSKDRYAFVSKQFVELGIAHSRISAVDKNILLNFECLQTDYRYWPRLFKAELACFLSHIKCWEDIAAGDDSYGAVFEDDVILSSDLTRYFSIDGMPENVDILKIETFYSPVKVNKLGSLVVLDRKAVKLVSFHPGSAGYILSKPAAKRLLDISRNGINCPVDHFLFDPKFDVMRQFKVWQLMDGLAVQQDRLAGREQIFASEIAQRSSSNLKCLEKIKLPLKRKVKREIMRIFNRFYYKIFTISLDKIDFK